MWLGGYLEIYIGTRPTAAVGALLFSTGIISSAFTCNRFIPTLLLYGLLPGLGTGIAYGIDCAVAVRWFPKRAGLVNGIVLAGYGLGALVFNPVLTYIINPENKKLPFHVRNTIYDLVRVL